MPGKFVRHVVHMKTWSSINAKDAMPCTAVFQVHFTVHVQKPFRNMSPFVIFDARWWAEGNAVGCAVTAIDTLSMGQDLLEINISVASGVTIKLALPIFVVKYEHGFRPSDRDMDLDSEIGNIGHLK